MELRERVWLRGTETIGVIWPRPCVYCPVHPDLIPLSKCYEATKSITTATGWEASPLQGSLLSPTFHKAALPCPPVLI